MGFDGPVASLEGDTPRARSPYVPGSRPGIVATRLLAIARQRDAFGGQKVEASPYPPVSSFRSSAPPLDGLTGKGFLVRPFRG